MASEYTSSRIRGREVAYCNVTHYRTPTVEKTAREPFVTSLGVADHAPDASATLFGHPKGLYVLFLTEMWERFSFYGVRSLLIFFLTQRFAFSDDHAFAIYGSYSALVYIYPLIGGMLADRYFGYSRSVMYGAILMIAGHAGLVLQEAYFSHAGALEPFTHDSPRSSEAFFLSLALLIAGVGLLKSNISTMVGKLYSRESAQRDSAFTIFNWGINIGSGFAAFTCGYVGQKYGWGYGFGLAGAGMILGLSIFIAGQRYLRAGGLPPGAEPAKTFPPLGTPKTLLLIGFVAVSILVTWRLIQLVQILGYLVVGTTIFALARALHIGFKGLGRIERERLWCALIIWAIWTCYATLVEQMGSSINLFNERAVNRTIHLPAFLAAGGSIEVQSSQLFGVTGFLLLILSPIFAWLWGFLERHNRNPSTPAKVCVSLFSLAAGYCAVAIGTLWPDPGGHVRLVWLMLLYFFFAIAALIVGPIGLSAVTRLGASRIVGFLVGLWMLGVALGSYAASKIAQLSSVDPLAMTESHEILAHYRTFFVHLALAAFLIGALFATVTPVMKRWMHGLR
jgi:POT family proton-dependent oligopeptide transporter